MTMPLLRPTKRQMLLNAAECLHEAFLWARSPQGHDYWKNVYTALMVLYHQQCEMAKVEELSPKVDPLEGNNMKLKPLVRALVDHHQLSGHRGFIYVRAEEFERLAKALEEK